MITSQPETSLLENPEPDPTPPGMKTVPPRSDRPTSELSDPDYIDVVH